MAFEAGIDFGKYKIEHLLGAGGVFASSGELSGKEESAELRLSASLSLDE